jgi:hypothetical protein
MDVEIVESLIPPLSPFSRAAAVTVAAPPPPTITGRQELKRRREVREISVRMKSSKN